MGNNPCALVTDGTYIWIANSADNTVLKLKASTGDLLDTYSVGLNPGSLTTDGTRVWVANTDDDTVMLL